MVPANVSALPLAEMVVTPYVPVPDTNGEEWDRLEPASALDALVELILHGEYNNIIDGERRTKDGMELRGAALGIFQVRPEALLVRPDLTPRPSRQNFVQKEEISEAIVQAMVSQPGEASPSLSRIHVRYRGC